MTILHGAAASRASRSLLALEELGLPYEQVPLNPWAAKADAEPLAGINPNRRVPVLDDEGLIIWESMAINLYLADRYGSAPFWPEHPRERALVYQWSLWSQTEIDVVARHEARFSDDAALKRRAEAERLSALAILDRALAGRPYPLGDVFTLADLNLAATLSEPWEKGPGGRRAGPRGSWPRRSRRLARPMHRPRIVGARARAALRVGRDRVR